MALRWWRSSGETRTVLRFSCSFLPPTSNSHCDSIVWLCSNHAEKDSVGGQNPPPPRGFSWRCLTEKVSEGGFSKSSQLLSGGSRLATVTQEGALARYVAAIQKAQLLPLVWSGGPAGAANLQARLAPQAPVSLVLWDQTGLGQVVCLNGLCHPRTVAKWKSSCFACRKTQDEVLTLRIGQREWRECPV